MKHFYLLLLLHSFILSAQNDYKKSVDSLSFLLKNINDTTTKVDLYQNICEIYLENDMASFKKANEELLHFSKKINSSKGYGFYYCNKAELTSHSNLEEAINYAKKSSQFFYQIKDWDNYIHTNTILASYLLTDGKVDHAHKLLTELLVIGLKRNSNYLSTIYLEFSKLYCEKADFVNALLYAENALSTNGVKNSYLIYNNISNIYRRMSRYDEALEYSDKAIQISKSLNAIHYSNYNKMEILCDMDRPKEALPLALTCLEYFKKQGYLLEVDYVQFMMSYAYYNVEDYDKATYYVDIVLKNPPFNNEYQMDKYAHKANICMALNDLSASKFFTNKALQLVDESVSSHMKNYVYNTKIKLEEQLGNYKEALFYQKKILKILKQKYSENSNNKLEQIQVDLNIAEKDNKIKNLQIVQLKKQVELTAKNDFIIFISLALIIAIVSVLFYVKSNRTIRRKNNIIEKEKLLTQKSLGEKETLLKEIHHRVKNNLQLVMSLLYLQSKQKDISIKEFVATSQSRIISMSLVHENLYGKSDLSKVDFKEYLNNLIQHILESQNNIEKEIQLQIEVDAIYLAIQTAIPVGLIINELISNAYKHAFKTSDSGIITLSLKEKNADFILEISDNGIGYATTEKKNNSLGLELVKQLVSQIQGNLQIQNNEGMQYVIHFKNGTV